jgi:hypothetical protein
MADYKLWFCEALCGVMEDNSMAMNLTMSGQRMPCGVRCNINQVVSLNRSLAAILLKVLLDYYSLIFLAGIDLRLTV